MDESSADPHPASERSPADPDAQPEATLRSTAAQPQQPVELSPTLEPAIEAHVTALLAAAAPLTMPSAVEERIVRALAEERQPATPVGVAEGSTVPRRNGQVDHDVLTPLIRQRQRPRRLFAAAAVAAAAALVGVGGSALELSGAHNGSAAAVVGAAPQSATSGAGTHTEPTVHIQLSRTAYAPATIVDQTRRLLASPGSPLRPGAAEAPSLGPIATQIGLGSCLDALGVSKPDSVVVDLGTYAGQPAAVIAVTKDGSTTAYAVRRSCTIGNPAVLLGATPLP